MAANPNPPPPEPIPSWRKGFNRAEVVDRNFTEMVGQWSGTPRQRGADHAPVLPGSACSVRDAQCT